MPSRCVYMKFLSEVTPSTTALKVFLLANDENVHDGVRFNRFGRVEFSSGEFATACG